MLFNFFLNLFILSIEKQRVVIAPPSLILYRKIHNDRENWDIYMEYTREGSCKRYLKRTQMRIFEQLKVYPEAL